LPVKFGCRQGFFDGGLYSALHRYFEVLALRFSINYPLFSKIFIDKDYNYRFCLILQRVFHHGIYLDNRMSNEIKDLFLHEAQAIMNIPVTEAYAAASDIIYRSVHQNGGKVVVSGMGKAGQIAVSIATTFSSTGTPAVWLHPVDAQHGDLGILCENDILLLVSNSGKTREIIELVALAKGLRPQIPIIVITGNPEGELARQADVCVCTGNPPEVCPLGLSPTTSTTVMSAIGDALVVQMMKRIGFGRADYAKRHHGGYLGQKSRGET
jgi:arabinose-5-phosphate isomerase